MENLKYLGVVFMSDGSQNMEIRTQIDKINAKGFTWIV